MSLLVLTSVAENAVSYMLFLKPGIILCQVMLYGELMIRSLMLWAVYSLYYALFIIIIFLLCWTDSQKV